MILITTSDYLPKLGGLSTFSLNIVNIFKGQGVSYDLFHWKNPKDIQLFDPERLSQYKFIINIHPQFAWLSKNHHEKMINFIHGSEILMTSPHPLKRAYKFYFRKEYFSRLEQCHSNIFISSATMEKARGRGLNINYSRDIILHNCIDTSDARLIKKKCEDTWTFTCIVRNVPHKNLSGAVHFCELVQAHTKKKVELIVPRGAGVSSQKIILKELPDHEDSCRDLAYQNAHYNLLLSKDESHRGFFEGFGLTVLESAKFGTPSIVLNTGGLPEAVHHGETGWVLNKIDEEAVALIFNDQHEFKYKQLCGKSFSHTISSHSLNEYERLFDVFNLTRRGA